MRVKPGWLALLGLVLALMATRWPLAPPFLFDWDNVNYALALKEFAPLKSQPHRGYPLFIGLSRMVYWFAGSPEWTGLVMGLIGSAVAVCMVRQVGRAMFGEKAGWIAAALLFCHPVFVLAGAVNHIRTFLAAGAAATAFFVWRGEWRKAAFVLGVAGGFRTEMIPVLAPLVFVWPLVSGRAKWRELLTPAGVLALTAAPWLAVMAAYSGGPLQMLRSNGALLRTAFDGHSLWYEGFTAAAVVTALFAAYWNVIGGLAWAWAVPWAVRRGGFEGRWAQSAFLAFWFTPPFLLNAVVQVTDPDQTLASVAATCVAGAWALSMVRWQWSLAACAVSVGLFVFPPKRLGREASLPWLRRTAAVQARAFEEIRRVPGPRRIVLEGDWPSLRQVSYYFPEDWVECRGVTAHGNVIPSSAAPAGLAEVVVKAGSRD